MIELLMNIWLALNIVFGIWSARNWLAFFIYCFSSGSRFNETNLEKYLDLVIPASCLAYYFTVSGV